MDSKNTLTRIIITLIIFLSLNTFAQNVVPFTPRFDTTVKGDIVMVGNSNLNRDESSTGGPGPNVPYNGLGINNDFIMQNVDIDSDATTFNSSSADLAIPAINSCYTIKYAALYWGATFARSHVLNGSVIPSQINTVKFKTPGGAYQNITGNVIYTSYTGSTATTNRYYACTADVTSIIQGLATKTGTYTLANIMAGTGIDNQSAGWSLFIIYEDPLASAKNITLFDGFSFISKGGNTLNIPITGFKTIPAGPVRAKLAFLSLEGDVNLKQDRLLINGTALSLPTRPSTNFFNSTINDINGAFTARNLNSTNTLGHDSGILNVPNPTNSIIANGATSATIRLETNDDAYVYYMNAFSIEVIQPQINLIKTVKDLSNNDIGNGTVSLGQVLYYDLEFQNIGNDDAKLFSIRDALPTNVNFLSVDMSNVPLSTSSYNAGTHTITFNIHDSYVTKNGGLYKIRIRAQVVNSCLDLRDACSNRITNQAFKTYSSVTNNAIVEDQQPSASAISSCQILTPGTTNFLANVDDCVYNHQEVLCGNSVVLTAANGYTSYQWHSSSPPTAGNLIPGAVNQTYTVNAVGTYSVVNTAPAPCLSITENFTVANFGGTVPNPVIPYADQVDNCPNDGSTLPKIFLCGTSDSRLIQTNIANASTIVWQKLNEASCTAVTNQNCPNTSTSCTWASAGPNGPNFTATDSGQYKVTITYQNGCFRTYYFNVYKTQFSPTVSTTDIICTTPGSISVFGAPASYEFSLTGQAGSWQSSNVFNIATPGVFTVYIRQIGGGVGNCVFDIPNIQVLRRDFTVNVSVNDALCNGGLGSIRAIVNNVRAQYYYNLYQGATLVSSAGPLSANDYTFSSLPTGNYTVNVTTDDGCTYSEDVTINNPPSLSISAAVTKPITCVDGEITVYPSGGTPPYTYTISGTAGFEASPVFAVTTPGTYTLGVTDFNGCTIQTNVTINANPVPVFNMQQTNILCYGNTSGEIRFVVTNANGYTLMYSIDNGGTFSSNPIFSNLPSGTYNTLVQYSFGGTACPLTDVIPITLTQPAAALTASFGVSELAGCGPMGEGKILISNPSGGTPGYQYSFNGGITWGALTEMYLAPGTYNVCIRDTNLCVFCSSVTIDPAPPAPTISISGPTYNCNSSGNITVNTNNNGGNYSYSYYLDGVLNTPSNSNVFSNIPCGPHNISIEYLNLTPPTTFNNLLIEDFGQGVNTTSPGIENAIFCWENQVPPSTCGNGIQINEQDYVVTRRINPIPNVWNPASDNTTNGTNVNGRFLCVNLGSPSTGRILYSKTINNIIPNVNVQVSLWAMTLLQIGNTGQEPNLTLELVKDLGLASQTIVSSYSTGSIPKTNNLWREFPGLLNPGNNTSLSFVIKSYSVIPANEGVGVVIDDIELKQSPKVCSNTVTYPILIDCNKAFTAQITGVTNASCNGSSNGQITIAAQNFALPYGFDYSINGGSTWTNSTISPVTISGFPAGTHNIVIRYNNTAGTCSFSFTQTITQPAVLIASASITKPLTCISNGEITASATGGTPNYQYQLQDGVGGILVAYQSNPVFSNLTQGTYVVLVRDALGCIDSIDASIIITAPGAVSATINPSSNLCYDGSNATTITVNASGGVPAYQYSMNGGAFQAGNTFSGLTPGSYTFTVRDSYGCTGVTSTVTVQPRLLATVSVTRNLNCTATPNAQITGNITGGTAPYTYEVSFNGGAYAAAVSFAGSNFTYSAATAGNYRFRITDAIGCTFVTSIVTVAPLPILNPPALLLTGAGILCFGDSNGSFSVTNSGGLPPYTVNVLNTTTGINYGTQTTGLTAGSYTVTITDANSCTSSAGIIINQPDAVAFTSSSTNILCDSSGGGTIPGTIIVSGVSGGTFPYTYYVSNSTGTFSTSYITTVFPGEDHSFSILNFGVYTVTVVDANGCQLSDTETIASPPNSLTITPTVLAPGNCLTGGSIQVCVNAAVLGGPYQFAIYQDLAPALPGYPTYPGPGYQPADAFPVNGSCSTFTGLIPGVTYSFIVFDQGSNCYYFETATTPIPTNSSMTATAPVATNVTCYGFADGNVSFSFSNYSGTDVTYQVYTALNNQPVGSAVNLTGLPLGGPTVTVPNFGPLGPGQYYVLITENDGVNAGCSITTANFTILQSPVQLSLDALVTKNDNCNANAGQITVTGYDGTPPYSYQIVSPTGGIAPTASTWAGQASNVFNVEGGSYDVYIKDAYNCIQSEVNVIVATDTNPSFILSLESTTLCNATDGLYEIKVERNNLVGVAPFTYSVDNSGFATYVEDASFSFILTNLNSGSHTVVIKDANACTYSQSLIIYPPVNSTTTVSLDPVENCGDSDGIITVNPSGGSGSFNYSISPNPVVITQSGNVFSNVPKGFYTVTVTDLTTTCSIAVPVTIETPAPVSFTAPSTPLTCSTSNDGSIIVNLTGSGNTDPTYLYQITQNFAPFATTGPQNSNTFNGLLPGNYTVVVTSGRNCSLPQGVTVGVPAPVTVNALTVTQFSCNASTNTNNNASIVIDNVSGGSNTYIYEFILGGLTLQSGPSNTYIESNHLGGSYTINVYDSNGCLGTTTADINPYVKIDNPIVSVIAGSNITCTTTESITISVDATINGVAVALPSPIDYEVVGLDNSYSLIQTDNPNFTGLGIGSYSITVTNPATGCSVQTIHVVNDPNTFIVTASLITNVTCYNTATASVRLTFIDLNVPTDEAGPFYYTVTNTSTGLTFTGTTTGISLDLSNLTAGIYQVQTSLVFAPECPAVTNFTITQPSAELLIFTSYTPITCANTGYDDGTISASATGGWGSNATYEYQLELGALIIYPWSSTYDFTGLAQGTYTVRVRDNGGCDTVFTTVVLTQPSAFSATLTVSPFPLLCKGDTTSSISIDFVSGGVGSAYLYTLVRTDVTPNTTSGPQTSNLFENLGAGTYSVLISDGNNCSSGLIGNVVINEPSSVVFPRLNKTRSETCTLDAELTLTASGGTAPYSYSTTENGTFIPLPVGGYSFNAPPGTYEFFVKDDNNCITLSSGEVTVMPIIDVDVQLDLSSAMILCSGETATVSASASGGLGNYVYSIYIPSTPTNILYQTSLTGTFTGVAAGSYLLDVTSNDCRLKDLVPFDIFSPNPLTFNRTITPVDQQVCPGTQYIASASILPVSGGTPPYQYSITPHLQVSSSGDFNYLTPGFYTIRVIDANGCQEETDAFEITSKTAFGFTSLNVVQPICKNETGSVELQIEGGTQTGGSVTTSDGYNLTVNGTTYNSLTGAFPIINLPSGTHTFVFTDDNDCVFSRDFVINEGLEVRASARVDYTCMNNTPGNVLVVTAGSLPVSAQSNFTYSLDGNPPVSTNTFAPVTVGNHTVLVTHTPSGCSVTIPVTVVDVTGLSMSLALSGLNKFTATTTGGQPPYYYTLDGVSQGTNNVFQIYATGTYSVTVTDANGCFDTQSLYVPFYDIEIDDHFTPDDDGNNDTWSPNYLDNFPNAVTYVFDRYSRKLITLRPGQSWNGTYNGKKLPTGDYWYVLKLNGDTDTREFVGNFTLYR